MSWQPLTDAGDIFISLLFSRIELIDRERQLVLTCSHGRTKWAPKYHVIRYTDPAFPERSKAYPKLTTIRAWSIDEALDILQTEAVDKRINKRLAAALESEATS